jgi:hypothetical protein
MSDTLRLVAVAVLCLTAGCGTGLGGDTGDGNTVNPALEETPTATPTPTPSPTPVLTETAAETGVPAQRAERHGAALRARSGAISLVRTVSAPNGSVVSRQVIVGRVDGTASLVRQRTRVFQPSYAVNAPPNATIWTNGSVVVRRIGGETIRANRPPRAVEQQLASGRATVYETFAEWPVSYAGSTQTSDGVVDIYAAERDRVERGAATPASNLTVTAVVADSGVVRRVRVSYETTLVGRNVTVSERFDLTAVGNVTVERAAWTDDTAAERLSGPCVSAERAWC